MIIASNQAKPVVSESDVFSSDSSPHRKLDIIHCLIYIKNNTVANFRDKDEEGEYRVISNDYIFHTNQLNS